MNELRLIVNDGVVDAYIHTYECQGETAPCTECWQELADHVEAVTAERDRARDLAAALEAQNAAVLALHREYKIYEECSHRHTAKDVETGMAVDIENVGITCEEGHAYSICWGCCAGEGEGQTEQCVSVHDLTHCWPCPTARALGVES